LLQSFVTFHIIVKNLQDHHLANDAILDQHNALNLKSWADWWHCRGALCNSNPM